MKYAIERKVPSALDIILYGGGQVTQTVPGQGQGCMILDNPSQEELDYYMSLSNDLGIIITKIPENNQEVLQPEPPVQVVESIQEDPQFEELITTQDTDNYKEISEPENHDQELEDSFESPNNSIDTADDSKRLSDMTDDELTIYLSELNDTRISELKSIVAPTSRTTRKDSMISVLVENREKLIEVLEE